MDENESTIEIRINIKTAFILGIILGMVFAFGISVLYSQYSRNNIKGVSIFGVNQVSAAEMHHEFICTCCGKLLDEDNICCGIAGDMIKYIDSQISNDLSEEEVILATVKKYGLKSLASEETKEKVKKNLAQNAPSDSPKIDISLLDYDFGEVSQISGVVSYSFPIRNTGESDLVINNLLSSCGCTSAALVMNGEEEPRFSMHNNPENWSATIEPGETVDLKIYYDPNVHKDFRGSATREVTVFSNDPVDFEKSIKIKLRQVD
ncbi:DUF1573 domain-containing protein [Patescibacteria group bacterium]|nr:DUF1573 domain-containing protein [Patescibacteria group bacterium]MBU1951878.1 DUF1573 domain-containing protein [Patescibacteria group bacterium]